MQHLPSPVNAGSLVNFGASATAQEKAQKEHEAQLKQLRLQLQRAQQTGAAPAGATTGFMAKPTVPALPAMAPVVPTAMPFSFAQPLAPSVMAQSPEAATALLPPASPTAMNANAAGLPPGWRMAVSNSGQTYYYNKHLNKSQYEYPAVRRHLHRRQRRHRLCHAAPCHR